MKYFLLFFSVVLFLTSTACLSHNDEGVDHPEYVMIVSDSLLPPGAAALIKAYPLQRLKYADNQLFFPDGTAIVYDDSLTKEYDVLLDNADIEDMFMTAYCRQDTPRYLFDVGRSRCEAFFKKMYGSTEKEVRKNLVKVDWFGQKLLFTTVNGAADQLKKVAEELALDAELRSYLTPSAGTFVWRPVRGATRLSAHSYGMTIDINTKYSNYWRWSNQNAGELDSIRYENRIPLKIVEVFEKHGFIWGGAWYHFDTMHFEYRPELLQYSL